MDVFKLCSVRPRWRIHYSTKKEKIQAKKTRPRKTVSSQTKRNGWFSRSNLGMYVYNDISLNVSLIRKHTVIKVERVDEWNLKRRACTVKDQRPSSKKKNIEALVKEPYFTWADLDPNYQSSKTDGRAQFGGIFEKTNISWVLEGLGMFAKL